MTGPAVFISGALTMGYVVAALFFTKFWRESRDVLFACFAGAFLLLAVGRALTGVIEPAEIVYSLRLAAFSVIIIGIVVKNRRP